MEPQLDFSIVKRYYHISPEGADHPFYEIPAERLLDPDSLKTTLRTCGEVVQATSDALPASFMGTTLCKLTLIQLLFAAQHDQFIDLSPGSLIFQLEMHDDHPHIGFKINSMHTEEIPREERQAFLAERWTAAYQAFITPAVKAFAAASGLKPEAIWQQFGGQLTYLRDFLAANERREAVIGKFDQGGRWLAELDGALFEQRRNPFKHNPRYVENPFKPGEQWLLHSSCCLYDRRENGRKCYTCPRMTDDEREARKREMLSAAGNT